MDIQIGEVTSTVRATDAETLLTPQLLRRIVAAALAEIKAREATEQQRLSERQLTRGVSAQSASWE